MSDREQLHELVDRLPEAELVSAVRYLEFLNAHEAPVDPEMLARIDEARAHPSTGIPHEEVLKEFGSLSGSLRPEGTRGVWIAMRP